jgi:hypothetical protein
MQPRGGIGRLADEITKAVMTTLKYGALVRWSKMLSIVDNRRMAGEALRI